MLHGYLELKLAWEMFQKAPDALSEPERIRVDDIARKQDRIELRILASAEAAQVAVPPATLKQRVEEIRGRYASEDDLIRDLERIGLTETDLDKAVERDLRVEGVLEKVATAAEPVSAVDAEIYYRLHPDAFDRPEARLEREVPEQRAELVLRGGLRRTTDQLSDEGGRKLVFARRRDRREEGVRRRGDARAAFTERSILAEFLLHFFDLAANDRLQLAFRAKNFFQLFLFGFEFFLLATNLHLFQFAQRPQTGIQNSFRLIISELEFLHHHRLWLILCADDLDDGIKVQIANEKTR